MSYWNTETDFSALVGLTLSEVTGMEKGSEEVVFKTTCGRLFRMYHYQDCCEGVSIEDVCGDVVDLIGSPVLMADEETNSDSPRPDGYVDSFTWTFYKLATIKGSVTLRWLGQSNGYYSEEVSFEEATHAD